MADSNSDALNILIAGDVNGNFRTFFSKVNYVNQKKGPFEAVYCLGNFFGGKKKEYEELKSGKIKVPIITYIMIGNKMNFEEKYEPLQKAVPKIVYLGKKGLLTTTNGATIAYLSGTDIAEELNKDEQAVTETFQQYNIHVSQRLVECMQQDINPGVDVLLTSMWPKHVTTYAVAIDEEYADKVNKQSSLHIGHIAKRLRPRYHFSGLANLYYERIPYRNHTELQETPLPLTRFYGLANVKPGKPKENEKWLYALRLAPLSSVNPQAIEETDVITTVCPYNYVIEEGDYSDVVENTLKHFFFEVTKASKKRSGEDSCENQPKKSAIDTSNCWFCLDNVDVEKHLIIDFGYHCYVTLAKGVLVPEHVLIVPLCHTASSVEIGHYQYKEIDTVKIDLIKYFHNKNKDAIVFERSFCSPHCQIQVIPVPRHTREKIEEKLNSYASSFQEVISLPSSASLDEVTKEIKRNFLYFEINENSRIVARYVAVFDKSKRYDTQIGRSIIAEALDLNDRKDWKKCIDEEEELKMCEEMRENFKI